MLGILSTADFFLKSTFSKNSFRNTIRVSNSLDPDHTLLFVGPGLGPTVCKDHQQPTNFDPGGQKVNKYGMFFDNGHWQVEYWNIR